MNIIKNNIKNNMVVPYSSEQMFMLVNNISDYSNFVPGCVDSRVLISNDFELTAKMDIFKYGVNQSFITHNYMIKNQSIMIRLIDGPLKSLFGNWKFVYISKRISRVECNFYYAFHSPWTERIFGYVVKEIVNEIINSFIFQANKVYK